jgi:hypothetical protein
MEKSGGRIAPIPHAASWVLYCREENGINKIFDALKRFAFRLSAANRTRITSPGGNSKESIVGETHQLLTKHTVRTQIAFDRGASTTEHGSLKVFSFDRRISNMPFNRQKPYLRPKRVPRVVS